MTSSHTTPGYADTFASLLSPAALLAWQADAHTALLRTWKSFQASVAADAVPVGQTAKDVVWEHGTARLYRYRQTTPRRYAVPLLMVHSLVSKPYILDLIPGNSFIEYLVGQGYDVYLIDWGAPRAEDSGLRLEHYVLDLLPAAISAMLETSAARSFNLFGYCMGGILALMYAATHPAAPVNSLITLATPVDFDKMSLQAVWARAASFDVDALVDAVGNIPASFIRQSFEMLKPASTYSPVNFLNLWQNVLNDAYVTQHAAFSKWGSDHIPFAGACFRQTVRELVIENRLFQGNLVLRDRPVDLKAITCDFLAIAGAQDHIVPLASTRMQPELVGSANKQLIVMDGGHVGMAAGRRASQTLWPKVAEFLAERSTVVAETSEAETAGAPATADAFDAGMQPDEVAALAQEWVSFIRTRDAQHAGSPGSRAPYETMGDKEIEAAAYLAATTGVRPPAAVFGAPAARPLARNVA